MKKNYLVSVIVPVYNIEKYIDRCIKSILNQTYTNYEIILIDDGSKDNSSIICDEYASKHDKIKVIHKTNNGLGMARNTGLSVAKGEFIKFVDGDDYIEPDHLENLMNLVNLNDSDTVSCGMTRVRKDGSKINKFHTYSDKVFEYKEVLQEIIPRLCGKKPNKTDNIEMSVCCSLYSSSIIKKFNIQFVSEREFISEDIIFNLDYLVHVKKISFSDDVGYMYCDNESSLTTSYRADRFDNQKKLENEIMNRVKCLGIYDLCEQRIYNTLISIARYSIKLEQKFYKDNGFLNSLKNIKKICKDEYLNEVFKIYNDNGASFKNKIVNFLIKHNCALLLWLIMLMKNKFDI